MMWNGPFGYAYGWGWDWFCLIIPLLFLTLIITGIVLLARYAAGWSDHPSRLERWLPRLDVLEERYARGEINRDEFLEKKRDITG